MNRKRRAEARGRWAEWLAAAWLSAKAYRVIARRQKTPMGELDLVARRGRVLAFIEVKARATQAQAVASLGWRQRERVIRAAALWRSKRPHLAKLSPRFDLMVVAPGRFPVHHRGAWRPEGRDAERLI